MFKTIYDYCEIAKSYKTITVPYLDASTLSGTLYVKSRFKRCTGCNSQSCPLYEIAPNQL